MTDTSVTCARCGRVTDQLAPEFLEWEAIGDGTRATCPDCVTPTEQQAADEDAMTMAEKVRENRLRRMAERQGLRLLKSRRRDPRAADYGTYMLLDVYTNSVVASGLQSGYGLSLDAIEDELTAGGGRR